MMQILGWLTFGVALAVLALHLWMIDLIVLAIFARGNHRRPPAKGAMLREATVSTLIAIILLWAYQPTLAFTAGPLSIPVSPWYFAALFAVKAAMSWGFLRARDRRFEESTPWNGPLLGLSLLLRSCIFCAGIWVATQLPLLFMLMAPSYLLLLAVDMAICALTRQLDARSAARLPIEITLLFGLFFFFGLAVAESEEFAGLIAVIVVIKLTICIAAVFFSEPGQGKFKTIGFWLVCLLRGAGTGIVSAWMIPHSII